MASVPEEPAVEKEGRRLVRNPFYRPPSPNPPPSEEMPRLFLSDSEGEKEEGKPEPVPEPEQEPEPEPEPQSEPQQEPEKGDDPGPVSNPIPEASYEELAWVAKAMALYLGEDDYFPPSPADSF